MAHDTTLSLDEIVELLMVLAAEILQLAEEVDSASSKMKFLESHSLQLYVSLRPMLTWLAHIYLN